MNSFLVLRSLTSPYNDLTRGSVLDHSDLDNNFIFLKGQLIHSGLTENNNLLLQSLDGSLITIPLNITGSTTGSSGFDVFVTGGTYSNGTAIFTNNTGGTFTVNGFLTGTTGSSGFDVFVTGGTYSNGTAIFKNNTGGTFTVNGFLTGNTLQQAYNNSTIPQITTTTTLSALTIQRGSAADTDILLQFRNGGGNVVSSIDGNGGAIFSSITSTRVNAGNNINLNNTKTGNTNSFSIFNINTVNFGTLGNDTSFALPYYGAKRFNTQSSGSTITTTTSNRQGVYFGTLQFENDVAATNNPITIVGQTSVFHAKVDFWPGASNQRKTINGTISAYSTFFDCGAVLSGTSLTTYIDFEAGRFAGNLSNPIFITDRYGFKVLDLNSGTQVTTNRWAFYQDGITDKNLFNGYLGLGIASPLAKLHITAGTTTIPPIIINSGVTTSIPIDGAIEYDGSHFYGTIGSIRKQLDNDASSNSITGATFSNNTLVLTNNTGGTVSTIINNFTGLTVNGSISATTISGSTIYGNGSNIYNVPFLIPSRLEFINSADTATYQNNVLSGSQIMMLSIESYQVGFLPRAASVYASFDSSTGTITLTNGVFATNDLVIIIYRTAPIFLLDGNGIPVRDINGNQIILN